MRSLFFLFCCCCIFSCQSLNDGYHLPRTEMQHLLEDLHLAETYSIEVNRDSVQHRNEKNYDSLAVYYQTILKHYDINMAQLEQSLQWYKLHPDQLDSIYANMIEAMPLLDTLQKHH